jgi:hypothetical protein
MRKTILSIALTAAVAGGLFLGLAPTASAHVRHVVVVGPGFYGPFYPYYGYYPYPPAYVVANYGEVKIDTHRKDAVVYIDGGYAARIKDRKKFALRPGNHNIELRGSDGETIYEQKVAVTVGQTTKLHIS